MKQPVLTLFVLAVVLVPWLAVVAIGYWIKAQSVRRGGAVAGKP